MLLAGERGGQFDSLVQTGKSVVTCLFSSQAQARVQNIILVIISDMIAWLRLPYLF